jgi:hypothetical protein
MRSSTPHVVDHLSPGVLVVIADVLDYGVPVLVICFALVLADWCWRTGHRPGALLAAAGPVLSVLAVVVVIAAAYGLDQVRLGSWQTDGSAPDPLDPRSTQ